MQESRLCSPVSSLHAVRTALTASLEPQGTHCSNRGRISCQVLISPPLGPSPQGLPWPRGLVKALRTWPGEGRGGCWEGLLQVSIFRLEFSVAFDMLNARGVLSGGFPPSSSVTSLPVTLGEKHVAPAPPPGKDPQRQGLAAADGHAANMPRASATSPTSLKDFFTSTKECQCAMGFRG